MAASESSLLEMSDQENPYSFSDYPYTDEPKQVGVIKSIDRSKQFMSDMMKMLLDGSSNDVCIKLHDGDIKANKNVLAARFAATFRWKSNNNHKPIKKLSRHYH